MKKVQENSIKLFNETIFKKVNDSKALHSSYDRHVNDLKKLILKLITINVTGTMQNLQD
ncbi:hypothetical protein [Mammaliicoccus lentus]|uniref:hypothetical protein n=1 Tax=Mammaliicoccus lentus TaxID=42858 RepID=UPI001430D6DC|nr:hypothetical protein [Mammaliicoccus lentus]MBF0749772.1 hypothetical protein [Mammaliicoccus lentus]